MKLSVEVSQVPLEAILGFRDEYRREMNCQIVHDSWHARGFTRSYLLRLEGEIAGYGSVGGAPGDPQDLLKEFYTLPAHRAKALPLFLALVAAGEARTIEAQTNDPLLSLMLFDCSDEVTSQTILFSDTQTTSLPAPLEGIFRPLTEAERQGVFPHSREPVGDWGIEADGRIVATGGIADHYNWPYRDLYMEVAAAYRERGFGSYLVQELSQVCRTNGWIASARCHQDNVASRRTLERAGMLPCARILRGRIKTIR